MDVMKADVSDTPRSSVHSAADAGLSKKISYKDPSLRVRRRAMENAAGQRNSSLTPDKNSKLKLENTYRTGPKESERFTEVGIKKEIQDLIDGRTKGFDYSAMAAAQLSRRMADDIRNEIIEMGCKRHKIVCVVTVCQKMDQGVMLTSRCLWDANNDGVITVKVDKPNFCVNASIFGVYFE